LRKYFRPIVGNTDEHTQYQICARGTMPRRRAPARDSDLCYKRTRFNNKLQFPLVVCRKMSSRNRPYLNVIEDGRMVPGGGIRRFTVPPESSTRLRQLVEPSSSEAEIGWTSLTGDEKKALILISNHMKWTVSTTHREIPDNNITYLSLTGRMLTILEMIILDDRDQ
jgi:hypothetical protein